jgi:hypothetical protein
MAVRVAPSLNLREGITAVTEGGYEGSELQQSRGLRNAKFRPLTRRVRPTLRVDHDDAPGVVS